MIRTLSGFIAALAIIIISYGLAAALPGASGPHMDYRSGYSGSCSGGAACHMIYRESFLPEDIVNNPSVTFTDFCLSCHNASGEAHEKTAGSPSNNVYTNATGLSHGTKGVSHNWKGVIGNSGTNVPTGSFFNRTTYMPGKKVACQTCHNLPKKGLENIDWVQASDSGDHIHYSVLGYASTPQYLSQYIKVYRSAAALTTPPLERRSRKQYLVSPSEYTYNYSNAGLTFGSSQGTSYIYVELAEPYLRGSNAANALCTDCHAGRNDQSVSHAPGSGTRDNHPVAVNYGYSFGLHSTLKPASTGGVYLENGQVLCTSCHDPHNAASSDGQVLREADGYTLCADCHRTKLDGYSSAGSVNIHNGPKHTSPTVCTDCHGHNSYNILLVKNVINGKAVSFQSFTGARGFGPDTGSGVCEACHTQTAHHLASNAPGGQGHNTGLDCTECHKHETGFQGGGCNGCHGFPPGVGGKYGPSTYGWSDATGNKHPAHMTYIQEKFGLSGGNVCACCHAGKPGSPHPDNYATAFMNTTSHIYWQDRWGVASFSDGGTAGQVSTSDDSCENVACHSTPGRRYWDDTPATCGTCHEYPGTSGDWTAGNGHSVRFDGVASTHLPATGYSAASDTYDSMTADPTRCGKCHPNNTSNHRNGAINVSAGGYAACGGGGFTFNIATTLLKVTCSNARCHSGTATPNWYGGTAVCGVCHGNPAKTGEPPAVPEDKDNCSNTGRGLHGVHMNYSSASYGKSSYGTRGSCSYCHTASGGGSPTATHNNGFVSITGHSATGRQNYDSTGLTYDSGTATCASACHRNRAETAPWGNYTATAGGGTKLACRACHDDVQNKADGDFSLSGAHRKHLSSAITVNGGSLMGAPGDAGCANCHPDNTDDRWSQGKADDGTKKAYPHASDGTNVVPDNATIIAGVSAAKNGLNTTCANACHRNTSVVQWGAASLNCDSCHYYSAAPTNTANDAAPVRLGGSHSSHFDATWGGITCDYCHAVPSVGDTSHATALPPVPDNAAILPSLGWNVTTHTCSSTGAGCHGDETTPKAYVITPDWTQPGQLPACQICHVYPFPPQ